MKNNIRTLDQFKDEHYGKAGTVKRNALESGYQDFKDKNEITDGNSIRNKAI